jgi:hypothetical protein
MTGRRNLLGDAVDPVTAHSEIGAAPRQPDVLNVLLVLVSTPPWDYGVSITTWK